MIIKSTLSTSLLDASWIRFIKQPATTLGADSVYAIQFQTILSGTNRNPYVWTTAPLLVLHRAIKRTAGKDQVDRQISH
jgi:hypothetical protein